VKASSNTQQGDSSKKSPSHFREQISRFKNPELEKVERHVFPDTPSAAQEAPLNASFQSEQYTTNLRL